VLLLDDVQFLIGKESSQEEFFHTFNTLVNFNRQVVIVSDRHPREMTTLEDRLRSRFQGGLVADVQPPELETRIAIVRMWARERRIDFHPEAIATIAERAPNNIRELEGAFNQVAAQTRLAGASLPMQRLTTTLERFMQPRERPTVKQIIEQVAVHHDLTSADLTGQKRQAHIAEARQIAMYLARELTDDTLYMIGAAFGRAHSTVLHSYNKIAAETNHDRLLEARLARIRKSVIGGD
jgi:chromosomal replication initiator protein